MTPIYGRSICNDPVTPPLHFGRFSAQGDIKCNDPCNDPVTPARGILQSKSPVCNGCNDVTAKKIPNGRCRKIGLKSQIPTYLPRPIQNDVTPVTLRSPQKTSGHIWGYTKAASILALYIVLIYNVCYEEIKSGHNCSIDGGSKDAAPSAI